MALVVALLVGGAAVTTVLVLRSNADPAPTLEDDLKAAGEACEDAVNSAVTNSVEEVGIEVKDAGATLIADGFDPVRCVLEYLDAPEPVLDTYDESFKAGLDKGFDSRDIKSGGLTYSTIVTIIPNNAQVTMLVQTDAAFDK